jgi:hypothetical protein
MEDYDGFDPQRQRTATSMRSPDLQIYASGPHWEGASLGASLKRRKFEIENKLIPVLRDGLRFCTFDELPKRINTHEFLFAEQNPRPTLTANR